MSKHKTVYCQKLNQSLPALTHIPVPGEMGQKIQHNISEAAWDLWLKHQIMIINENRLDLSEPKSQQYLFEQMEAFLFHNKEVSPTGYQPEES